MTQQSKKTINTAKKIPRIQRALNWYTALASQAGSRNQHVEEILVVEIRYLKILPTPHDCEVYFGLEGEDAKSENYGAGDPHSDHDFGDIEMGGDGAHHEALCQGEDTKEDEVAGSFAAHVFRAAGTNQREQHHKAHDRS